MLTKGTDLEFTKVMQLYDGLSINQNKETLVQVEDLPRNECVKLVKLKLDESEEDGTSSFQSAKPALKGRLSQAGKRDRIKKMFASWFKRAPDDTEDNEKEDSGDEIETTSANQRKSARASIDKSSLRSENNKKNNKNDAQLKLVDMGGHTATVVLAVTLFIVRSSRCTDYNALIMRY